MIEFKVRLNDDGTMTIDPPPLYAYDWCFIHNKGIVIALRDGGPTGVTTRFEDFHTYTSSGCAFGMSLPRSCEPDMPSGVDIEAWALNALRTVKPAPENPSL